MAQSLDHYYSLSMLMILIRQYCRSSPYKSDHLQTILLHIRKLDLLMTVTYFRRTLITYALGLANGSVSTFLCLSLSFSLSVPITKCTYYNIYS